MQHKTNVLGFLIGAAILFGGAPAHAQKTFRAAMGGDLRSLDPVFTYTYTTRSFAYLAFDMLFAQDSKGQYKPQMVDRYEVTPDKLTWTFHLRDGLLFSDGQPVRAEDCVASIKRWAKRDSLGQKMFAATASFDAIDDKTFVLKLARPFGLVIEALGKPSSNVPVIMPARLAATDAFTEIRDVIGSGPFVLKRDEWVPGDKAILVKNPLYKPRPEPADGFAGGKVVKIDRVAFLSLPDSITAVTALERDELDFVQVVPVDLLPRLRVNKNIKVETPPGIAEYVGVFRPNHAQVPFNNPQVRKVLQVAFNQKDFLAAEGIPQDKIKPCFSLYTCGSPFESAAGSAGFQQPSLERAKTMLKASGYNGEKVVLLHATSLQPVDLLASVVAETLRSVGFNVEDRAMDFQAMMAGRMINEPTDKRGGWSGFTTATHGYEMSDPIMNPYIGFNCQNFPGWTCDEETKPLFDQFIAATDPDQQKQLAARIHERANETVSVVALGQFALPFAYRSRVKGLLEVGIPLFWNLDW